jgi:hypothetical protein
MRGNPTILDPFGSSSETALSPSPRGAIPTRLTIPFAFRIHSADCRLLGLETSTRHPGLVNPRYSAFTTVTVDFPHCREQFKIPRFAVDRSTPACCSSGWKPKRVLANSTSSILVVGRLTNRRVPSPTKFIDHPSDRYTLLQQRSPGTAFFVSKRLPLQMPLTRYTKFANFPQI